ncbi:MAG: bifunctional adenosylcobinamide kinase/adenosylcobinamide-phosphate guanylyltransferase [Lachnospiraceae bacterium]|nr:bifunctional adenosylcobinamide kinase/adenosylcobinamide-phosphate guanylyltransferase [Lachnospiraceae bacterium]
MLVVITGGSGSGKSKYAEEVAVDFLHTNFQNGRLYYIATMKSFDEETDKKIARHQEMRKGKGFETIECPIGLGNLKFTKKDVVLVECMSNLLANEMYAKEGSIQSRTKEPLFFQQVKDAIVHPIFSLKEQAGCVVVVTNEVFSDGLDYSEESLTYIEGLGYINQQLGQVADEVAEVVCGIPVWIKKKEL